MNLNLLILYLAAAIMLLGIMIKIYKEHEAIGRSLLMASFCAIGSIVGYSVNFMTDNYTAMSIGVSVNIIFQDFLLISLLDYCIDFTRLRNKCLTVMEVIFVLVGIVDTVMFILNVFTERILEYSFNMVGNSYVLGYETNYGFSIHALYDVIILGFIISLLVIKCIRIPSVYWGRYTSLIFGGLIVLAFKYLFISDYVDIRFDISILLYALLGVLLYWNTFWYSKKNMLGITHTMIIDHMKVPVILFDYEGVVADFNTALANIFPDIEIDNRDQTIDWFANSKKCFDLMKKSSFNWTVKDRIYDCKVHNLKSKANRLLGVILVMQDITELTNAYDKLERSVTFDALTGLYNKRCFYKESQESLSQYLSICVTNLDNLGRINDNFGQDVGDRVLIGFANILTEKLSKNDYIARLDDGNIAILSKKKDTALFIEMTEIKGLISKRLSTKKMKVTMEFGLVTLNKEESIDVNLNIAISSMRNKKMLSKDSARNSLVGSLKQGMNEYDMQIDKQIERERILCDKFAIALELSDVERAKLAMLATLHDIGKVSIPNSVLAKTEALDESERELIKSHSIRGYRIARAAKELVSIADEIRSHHERYDGSGYPDGLSGDNIPLLSRVFTIVDAYDAMTHDRPYKKTLNREEAIEELRRCSGSQFDPKLVDIFVNKVL